MNAAATGNSKEKSSAEIGISVLIPVWDERARLSACLDSILAHDESAPSFEVLIIEGQSPDNTAAQVAGFEDDRLRHLVHPGRSAAAALNCGLRSARGKIIVRVDARTRIAPDYLGRIDRFFAARTFKFKNRDDEPSPLICIGGAQRPQGNGQIAEAIAAISADPIASGGASYRAQGTAAHEMAVNPREVDTVYLGSWPREAFSRLGGFDESLARNQDDEFSFRLRRRVGQVMLDPLLASHYEARTSLLAVAKQYFGFGLWKPRVLWRYPQEIRLRHLAPFALVLATALLGVAAFLSSAAGLALSLLGALWLLLNLKVARRVRRQRHRISLAAVVIAVAAVQQFSYGMGFLCGVLRGPMRPAPQIPAVGVGGEDEIQGRLVADRDQSISNARYPDQEEGKRRRRALATLLGNSGLHASTMGCGLEVGIGKGDFARDFIDLAGRSVDYYGVDLSCDRLQRSRRRLGPIFLARASGQALPFADSSFEFLVLATVLSSILDQDQRAKLLTEAQRVVAPGGIILIYDLRLPVPGRAWHPVNRAEFEELWGPAWQRQRVGIAAQTRTEGKGKCWRQASAFLTTTSAFASHEFLLYRNQKSPDILTQHA
ncbi:MAG: glycosyltransferase [Planctomycetota bacterium]